MSAYSINERASTTLGLTLSHLVDFSEHQGNKIVPQHLVPTSLLSRNQRRINVDRVSISGGFNGSIPKRPHKGSSPCWCRATSNADSYSRCFSQFDRKTDCFDGVKGSRIRAHPLSWMQASDAFKAVCGTQSRMPEGFNLNQIQALSTPDNLVGGAVMRTIPTASRGLNHPTKGGSYV